ncbi:MAG: hypothetical protein FJ214_00445 [Ignavibacteria bacterium]|nr:hypothetical protein [Ignavibacteria bacterium]
MNNYLKAVKENVCSICVDSNDKGICTLNSNESCAVEIYLPQIVELIHKNENEKLSDIQKKLKETICVECETQSESGVCYLREDANCSLDRYFSLIVETINRVDNGLT